MWGSGAESKRQQVTGADARILRDQSLPAGKLLIFSTHMLLQEQHDAGVGFVDKGDADEINLPTQIRTVGSCFGVLASTFWCIHWCIAIM